MATDTDGNLFFSAGFLNSATVGDTTIQGSPDYSQFFLTKLDSSGKRKWVKTSHGASGGAGAKAISVDDHHNIYITGDMQGEVNFDGRILSEPGGGIFTLKIKDEDTLAVVSVRETKLNTKNQINVFPNPTNDYITIESENILSAHINIYNILGQSIYSKDIKSYTGLKERVLLSHTPKGIYFIKITSGQFTEVKKIILE